MKRNDNRTGNVYVLAGYDEELEFVNCAKRGGILMSQANYDAMSDTELRHYFLEHRQDQSAFQAHLDRLNQRPRVVIASPDDPDFDEKIQAAIRQKLEASGNK